ncbi:MAG: helix-turn-helix domain-containing protein [Proteobacteria bacterium]|nr:helix-turn-helix domain-containing protein [Pseudomonadota bacterium]
MSPDPAASDAGRRGADILTNFTGPAATDRLPGPVDRGERPGEVRIGEARPAESDARAEPAKPDHPERRTASERTGRLRNEPWPDEDRLAGAYSSARMLGADKDQPIYAEGEPAEFCYRLLGGCVRMVKLMEDGRRQVTEFLLPGDMLGLDTLDAYDLTAEAVVPTTLRRYRRAAVEALADRDPVVARRLRSFASNGLRAARERMMLLGRKTATERIASFLLEMTARAPPTGRNRVALPMGRADIADHLGLTTETVCRVLTCLRVGGTITTSPRRDGADVTIRDPATLRALAAGAPLRAREARRAGAERDPPAPTTAATGGQFARGRADRPAASEAAFARA